MIHILRSDLEIQGNSSVRFNYPSIGGYNEASRCFHLIIPIDYILYVKAQSCCSSTDVRVLHTRCKIWGWTWWCRKLFCQVACLPLWCYCHPSLIATIHAQPMTMVQGIAQFPASSSDAGSLLRCKIWGLPWRNNNGDVRVDYYWNFTWTLAKFGGFSVLKKQKLASALVSQTWDTMPEAPSTIFKIGVMIWEQTWIYEQNWSVNVGVLALSEVTQSSDWCSYSYSLSSAHVSYGILLCDWCAVLLPGIIWE